MDVDRGKLISKWAIDLIPTFCCINFNAVLLIFKAFHDWDGLTLKSKNTFLHGLRIVVCPSTGLGSLSHAVNEGLCGAVEVNQVSNDNLITQYPFKDIPILLIPGEAVKQVPTVAIGVDTFFNQLDDQVRRDELSFFYVAIDGLRQFSTLLLLLPQKVSRWEMLELVIPDEIFSLRSLATARTAKEEEDVGFGEDTEAVCLFLSGWWSTCEVLQPMVSFI